MGLRHSGIMGSPAISVQLGRHKVAAAPIAPFESAVPPQLTPGTGHFLCAFRQLSVQGLSTQLLMRFGRAGACTKTAGEPNQASALARNGPTCSISRIRRAI